ncbi:hypothetical protein AQJ23_16830 [Streptomyces antibioticus]|nr:hypothetical protein AQJ23_16830 [Streptomyces antibioticus]
MHNLSAAAEKTCVQHRVCLRKQADAELESAPRRIIKPLPPPALPPTKMAVRTVDRYSDVHRLFQEGCCVSAIARRLHLDRKTVRRFRDTDTDTLLASSRIGHPRGVLEPYTEYLTERFTEGVTGPAALYREICERGYHSSDLSVHRYVARLRTGTIEPARGALPSPRKITKWIMLPRGSLGRDEERELLSVRLACPDIARACDLARTFHDLLQHQRGHQLLPWVREAERDAPPGSSLSRRDCASTRMPSPPASLSRGVRASSRTMSTASRRSSAPCTVGPRSASSAPGSCFDHDLGIHGIAA